VVTAEKSIARGPHRFSARAGSIAHLITSSAQLDQVHDLSEGALLLYRRDEGRRFSPRLGFSFPRIIPVPLLGSIRLGLWVHQEEHPMTRTFISAALVALAAVGLGKADEFYANITKVEDGKVTFFKVRLNKDTMKTEKFGEDRTLPTTKDVMTTKTTFDFKTEKATTMNIEGGLKNDVFTKIDLTKKSKIDGLSGLRAVIVTNEADKNIVEIHVGGFPGMKRVKDKKVEK
jgi:hypothetical protein